MKKAPCGKCKAKEVCFGLISCIEWKNYKKELEKKRNENQKSKNLYEV